MRGLHRRLGRTLQWVKQRRTSLQLRSRRLLLGRSGPVVTAFTYHRVTDSQPPDWGPWRYAVSRGTFAAHVRRLADRYAVVDLTRVLEAADGDGTLPERAAVVTFDDGYRDTLTRALPVLERYEVPATVYVSTGLLGSDAGPFSFRLAAAFDDRSPADLDFSETPVDGIGPLPSSRREAYRALYSALKFEPPDVRERTLKALVSDPDDGSTNRDAGTEDRERGPANHEDASADPDLGLVPMLTEAQVRSLADHEAITVGSHGHDHCPLSVLSDAALSANVERSRDILGDILTDPVRHFSYPYGDYDQRVAGAVEAAGFETAVTTEPDVLAASHTPWDRYALPRVDAATFRP